MLQPDASALFAFDPRQYPRVYRMSAAWRAICWGMGVPLLAVSLWLAYEVFVRSKGGAGAYRLGAFSTIFAAVGTYLILRPIRSKLVLTADSITQTSTLLPSRCLRRDEIAGMRALPARGGIAGIALIPNRATLKPLEIEPVYATDELYTIWMTGFRDLAGKDGPSR